MITALAASQAYAAAAKTTGMDSGASLGAATGTGGGGFADILKSAMTDAMQASKNAETQMTNHVQGKGDLVNVVTAISSAETSLQTMLAVRDQVISAYQEIMRMPI